jgi:hypothetical protein
MPQEIVPKTHSHMLAHTPISPHTPQKTLNNSQERDFLSAFKNKVFSTNNSVYPFQAFYHPRNRVSVASFPHFINANKHRLSLRVWH